MIVLFNKPFNVLTQFTDDSGRDNLSNYINIKELYPAGRLDKDSEGLLILTDNGRLQHAISHPKHKLVKLYWVQVEGDIDQLAINELRQGVELKDGPTAPAHVKAIPTPTIWNRNPPVRFRAKIPTSWIEVGISEGKNRQIRRMTAAVGFPTLRLIRIGVGPWRLDDLEPGQIKIVEMNFAQFPSEWRKILQTPNSNHANTKTKNPPRRKPRNSLHSRRSNKP